MFTTKIIASLFLVATAGFLDAGRGLVGEQGTAQAGTDTSARVAAPALAPASMASSLGDIRRDVARALTAQVRKDLDDPRLAVDVSGLVLRREGEALVSVDGLAHVSLDAGGTLPLQVAADWNVDARRIDRLDYRVSGAAVPDPVAVRPVADAQAPGPSAGPALGQRMRDAIQARLNDGLAQEFSSQHPRFELVAIEHIASGRYRMVVTGTGITRFPGEGAAFTRFSASVGKFDGLVAQADYELLQQIDPQAPASQGVDARQVASR